MKEALLREWVTLPIEERHALKCYLLDYISKQSRYIHACIVAVGVQFFMIFVIHSPVMKINLKCTAFFSIKWTCRRYSHNIEIPKNLPQTFTFWKKCTKSRKFGALRYMKRDCYSTCALIRYPSCSLAQYIQRQIFVLLAILVKRGVLEPDGLTILNSYICDISQLISNSFKIEVSTFVVEHAFCNTQCSHRIKFQLSHEPILIAVLA